METFKHHERRGTQGHEGIGSQSRQPLAPLPLEADGGTQGHSDPQVGRGLLEGDDGHEISRRVQSLELQVHAGTHDRYRTAVAVVAGVGDPLIVDGQVQPLPGD